MTTWSGPWCLQCARPAVDLGPSLAAGYRVVDCRRGSLSAAVAGHGRVLGTMDVGEARDRVEAARLARVARAHPAHRTKLGIHRECPACLARGAHLDHLELRRAEPGCAECDQALARAASAHVGR